MPSLSKSVLLAAAALGAVMPASSLNIPRANRILKSNVQLTPNTIALVTAQLAHNANHSWEIGTRETALLELNSPSLFIYSAGSSIPPPRLNPSTSASVVDVFASVDSVLAQKPATSPTFFVDGAVGDPASVGIPFLIRNATLTPPSASSNYSLATNSELNWLLYNVSRDSVTGAISQRNAPEPVQLWADFVGMAPAFLAYYGALHKDQSLLTLAYNQVAAYRTRLLDTSVNLLQHIVLSGGPGTAAQDLNHWGTGNAWFVMGAIRVARIIQLSSFRGALSSQASTLLSWSLELSNSAWSHQQASGALWNYIDMDPATSNGQSFEDSAGTALIAANTFRLAALTYNPVTRTSILNGVKPNVAAAEKARQYIVQHVDTTTGLVGPIVNPLNWRVQLAAGGVSPEGEAFVLLLQAAYRDWYALTNGYY